MGPEIELRKGASEGRGPFGGFGILTVLRTAFIARLRVAEAIFTI